MKKLLGIVILSLVLCSNVISEDIPIKKKKIKCLFSGLENKKKIPKEYYKYFIFSDDDLNAVELHYGFYKPLEIYRVKHNVKKNLTEITMTPVDGTKGNMNWILNRQTGKLSEKINYNNDYYGKCSAVDKNFDPTEYLENLVNNYKKKIIDQIKF